MATLLRVLAFLATVAYFAAGLVVFRCPARKVIGALLRGKKGSGKFQFPLPAEPCESVLISEGGEEGGEERREGSKERRESGKRKREEREQMLRISEMMVEFEDKLRVLQKDLDAAIAENEHRRALNEKQLTFREQERGARGAIESIRGSEDMSSLTVVQLKLRCRELGLPVSGTKAALFERVFDGGARADERGGNVNVGEDSVESTPPAAATGLSATIEACKS